MWRRLISWRGKNENSADDRRLPLADYIAKETKDRIVSVQGSEWQSFSRRSTRRPPDNPRIPAGTRVPARAGTPATVSSFVSTDAAKLGDQQTRCCELCSGGELTGGIGFLLQRNPLKRQSSQSGQC